MNYLTLILGKFIQLAMRLAGKNGGTLPGLIIEKINKKFLAYSLNKLSQGVVIVTGTNGKTTTTKVLSELLKSQGLRVLTNQTGGNYVRGVISLILENTNYLAKLNFDIAVLELDEAHGVHFANYYPPRGVVALNVLRDQLDRFGEIDVTANLIGKMIKRSTEFVLLNSNDPRIAKLADDAGDKNIYWFGHSESLKETFKSDDQHYEKNVKFFEANKPNYQLSSYSKDQLEITHQNKTISLPFKLSGSYNALNITASLGALEAILNNFDIEKVKSALNDIRPAFGRGEKIELDSGGLLQLQLVKNPAGFNQALNIIKENSFNKVALVINDNYADGRDVSWLFDVDFSPIKDLEIYTSGIRYLDMAVRLKYQGMKSINISSLEELIKQVTKDNKETIIYCTYTAMLEIRKLLRKQGIKISEVGL